MVTFGNYPGNERKVLDRFEKKSKVPKNLVHIVIENNKAPKIFGLKDKIAAYVLEQKFYRLIGLETCSNPGCFMFKSDKLWIRFLSGLMKFINGMALCNRCHELMEVLYVEFIRKSKGRSDQTKT